MSHGKAIAARDGGTLDDISLGFWDRWGRQRMQVEEDNDFRARTELLHKLCEYDGNRTIADLIKEDTNTIRPRDDAAAVSRSEFGTAVFRRSEELGRLETIFPFRSPLLHLAKAPQYEDEREDGREHECEPSTFGDFVEC